MCFWRWSLIVVNIYMLFFYYLPLENSVALHLYKLDTPLQKDAVCKFIWNWSNAPGENENVKKFTPRWNLYHRWSVKLTWALSSVELINKFYRYDGQLVGRTGRWWTSYHQRSAQNLKNSIITYKNLHSENPKMLLT